MAEKSTLYKGVKYTVAANGLIPETNYYAMLRNETDESFISSELTASDENGSAIFVFSYEMTNELEADTTLTLIIVEEDRDSVAFYKKNLVKVVATSLKDELDITTYQKENVD